MALMRSDSAFKRRIILPYSVLLALYLAVVGGGGAWLYHQVRAVEAQLLIDEVKAALEPLAKRLDAVGAAEAMQSPEPWLVEDLQALFTALPALRVLSVRGPEAGFRLFLDDSDALSIQDIAPLVADSRGRQPSPRRRFGSTRNRKRCSGSGSN